MDSDADNRKARGRLRRLRIRLAVSARRHGDANFAEDFAFFANVSQVTNAPDVDQDRRLCQPQLHRRDETVTAGQYLGVVGVLLEQRERFVERRRLMVIELRWNHNLSLRSALLINDLPYLFRLEWHIDVAHTEWRERVND